MASKCPRGEAVAIVDSIITAIGKRQNYYDENPKNCL